ncbi:uncharacterized protein LOC131878854 [Tigriopus californicus]|uniref:uncharacterized protein LOC131878854 n=1 Tax=Tigriopus californicus TaxID=6832 RepID=UPI0027DAB2D7|nr:uncharacterized protein LOC131878854 [Tigriopus californicus]
MKLSKRIVLALLFLIHVFNLTLGAKTKAKKTKKPKYFIGQVPPGQFEYSELHGVYTPTEATQLCEEDLQCAGFTFKGTPHEEQKYLTNFFHYIPKSVEKHLDHSRPEWSTYRNKRPFLAFSGLLADPGTNTENVESFANILKSSSKTWEQFNWPLKMPVLSFKFGDASGSAYASLDLGQLKLEEKTTTMTFFDPNSNQITENHPVINRCCVSSSAESVEQMKSVDEVDKQRCDIEDRLFENAFEIQRQPVLLTECAATCSKLNWTLSNLIRNFDTEATWSAKMAGTRSIQGDVAKILETLSVEGTAAFKSVSGLFSGTAIDKMLAFVLDHEGAQIGPKTRDLAQTVKGEKTQMEFVMLSRGEMIERESAKLESDSKFTLISGKISWLLLPMDSSTFKTSLSCNKKCSSSAGNVHFFETVFPQIKTRIWNGKRSLVVHQRPGDTLYIPRDWIYLGVGHEPSNLVHDEFISFQALADVAKSWHQGDLYKLKKVLGSHDNYRKEFRRFNVALDQIVKGRKKSKNA